MGGMKRPSFVYLHYLDPHSPYTAPEPYSRFFDGDYVGEATGKPHKVSYYKSHPGELKELTLLYDNEIRYVDYEIGLMFDRLKEDGSYNNSIIIFMADHGEMFLEHGLLQHSNGVYGEVTRIPLIIKGPLWGGNRTVDAPVQNIDILPTILEALNVSSGRRFMGQSIPTALNANTRLILSEHLRMGWDNPSRGLVVGRYHLIERLDKGDFELYDIEADRVEGRNIFNETPESKELVEDLREYIMWINSTNMSSQATQTELDNETIEQLRSLGYLN
jgi:arylsulfatase A-like enzyme